MKKGQKGATNPANPRQNRNERLKDEVYRQMFRLEEGRAGAEIGLAAALLRAWITAGPEAAGGEEEDWLKKISRICLGLIEASSHASGACSAQSRPSARRKTA